MAEGLASATSEARMTWYEMIQFGILVFAFLLMLSKDIHILEEALSFFYETEFSLIAALAGAFSVLHGLYMAFESLKKFSAREAIETVIVISCGLILLSPAFNTAFKVPYLEFLGHLPHEVISHLAWGLLPIILVYFVDMFRKGHTD